MYGLYLSLSSKDKLHKILQEILAHIVKKITPNITLWSVISLSTEMIQCSLEKWPILRMTCSIYLEYIVISDSKECIKD